MQACGQLAGVRFLKHNIRDDFDDPTDVARLYGVRSVPCFVFLVGGAPARAPETLNPNILPSVPTQAFGSQGCGRHFTGVASLAGDCRTRTTVSAAQMARGCGVEDAAHRIRSTCGHLRQGAAWSEMRGGSVKGVLRGGCSACECGERLSMGWAACTDAAREHGRLAAEPGGRQAPHGLAARAPQRHAARDALQDGALRTEIA